MRTDCTTRLADFSTGVFDCVTFVQGYVMPDCFIMRYEIGGGRSYEAIRGNNEIEGLCGSCLRFPFHKKSNEHLSGHANNKLKDALVTLLCQ